MLNGLHDAECRFKANEALGKFLVQSPDDIDLDTIVWLAGKLRIEYGELDTADGRLTAANNGGTIRVKSSIANEGRRRFVIAHELGHYCLHKAMSAYDTAEDIRTWDEGSKETEANVFAGELLLPENLLKPLLYSCAPSLKAIDLLADKFKISNLATGVQYVTYTMEPCALVVSRGGSVSWARKSKDFGYFIPRGQPVSSCSSAGEILSGKSGDTNGMVKTPAWAWLPNIHRNSRAMIMEDSRHIEAYQMVVTLLWIDEILEDD